MKSDIRRKMNFESANIKKTIAAMTVQRKAIESLISSGKIDRLPPELKATALLRIENIDLSIGDLAALHNPPLSKSGLNHRLQKIVSYANETI